ncbi:MAG TPA: peptidyl-prolyl cis-trans isomerase [Verrucomicrobiae bacterium]|jgi:peptidyl-prolyl cis-trans isomerase SurA
MKLFRFILGLAVCASLPARAEPAVIDGIKGVVSAQAVTFSEVEDFSRPAADSLRRQYASQPDVFDQKLKAALDDSLQQLIERQLILHSFETDGYKLPDSVVDEAVQDRIRERFGDRVTFMKTLQAQGLTVEQFRKQVRDQYIESALRNQNVQREIFISPFKVENYYLAHQDDFRLEEQIRLRMIVLTKSAPDDTNTLKLAREIQAKIKEGAPFAEMASIYSQGSQQHQGGDWGWVQRSVLRKELAEVAFTLPVNNVSDVIDTPDSFYLMLVEDKKTAQVRPLTEVAVDIEKTLRIQQQARLQKQWIDGLRKKTFVTYF